MFALARAEEAPRSLLGRALQGRWRIEAVLGKGRSGTVYRASDEQGQPVAVKVLHARLSEDPDLRDRALATARAAARLRHPAIAGVIEADVSFDGQAFIVLELLTGETVEAQCARTGAPMAVAAASRIGEQVLEALAVAHAAGVVHGGLNPAVLWLAPGGAVKVHGFGDSALSSGSTSTEHTLTSPVLDLGKVGFLAPEQVLGLPLDPRTDLWALAACLHALVSGRLVHAAASAHDALRLAATSDAPGLASAAPWIEPAFARVVDGALGRERCDRWPDAATMLRELRRASAAHEAGADVAPRPGPSADPPVSMAALHGGDGRATQLLAGPRAGGLHVGAGGEPERTLLFDQAPRKEPPPAVDDPLTDVVPSEPNRVVVQSEPNRVVVPIPDTIRGVTTGVGVVEPRRGARDRLGLVVLLAIALLVAIAAGAAWVLRRHDRGGYSRSRSCSQRSLARCVQVSASEALFDRGDRHGV